MKKEIETYELQLNLNRTDNQLLELLETKRQELQDTRKATIAGTMIRSKARWIEHGEKPTNYFCNLENRNFITKTIAKLEIDGQLISEPEEILKQQANFYKKLYSC